MKPSSGTVHHVTADDRGQTLAAFLRAKLASGDSSTAASWSQVQKLVRSRHVLVHGNICTDFARRLKIGEVVKVLPVAAAAPPKADDVRIVYVDDQVAVVEKPHSYKSGRGDPRISPETKATHSQFRMGIWVSRPGWGLYFKMFHSLYVAVGIAMLVFFIKPTDVDPRFGLGVGALFAAVANSYITSSMVPDTGVMTLADVVNGLGVLTILVTVAQSTISLHIYDIRGEKALSRRFDRVSVVMLATGFACVNVALPLAAAL